MNAGPRDILIISTLQNIPRFENPVIRSMTSDMRMMRVVWNDAEISIKLLDVKSEYKVSASVENYNIGRWYCSKSEQYGQK